MSCPKAPTLDRIQFVREKSQAIGEFLSWLSSVKGLVLCREHEHDTGCYKFVDGFSGPTRSRMCGYLQGGHEPAFPRTEQLLAEYFNVDLTMAETERRSVLAHIRRPPRATP